MKINCNNRTKLPRILLAECDYELRSFLKHILERSAFVVHECSSVGELQSNLESSRRMTLANLYELVLVERQLLEESIVDSLRTLQESRHCPPLVVIDGWQRKGYVHIEGLEIAETIDSPADAALCVNLIRRIAPHRHPG